MQPAELDQSHQAARFRALLDQSNELVFILDPVTAIILDASEATLRISNLERHVIVGQNARRLRCSYPLQSEAQWLKFVTEAAAPGGLFVDLDLGHKDGGTYAASFHVTMTEFEGRPYLLAAGRRRTSTEVHHAELAREHAWQSALLAIATDPSVTSGILPAAAMEAIARRAAEAMPCSGAAIWRRLDDSTLEALAAWHLPDVKEGTRLDLKPYPWLLEAFRAGRALDLLSTPEPERRADIKALLAKVDARACAAAPIRRSGEVSGVICFCNTQVRLWSSEEMGFAAAAADQCSAALMNADHRRIQDTVRESEQRYRAFVRLSAEAIWRIEFEDPTPLDLPVDEQVTRLLHGGRVAECNDALAHFAGFSEASAIVGRYLVELLNPLDGRLWDELRHVVRSRYTVQNVLTRHVDIRGREYWLLRNMTGVIENERLVRLWGFTRDVTEKKRAEDVIANLARWTATGHEEEFFSSLAAHLATTLRAEEAVVAAQPVQDGLPAPHSRILAHWRDGALIAGEPDWLAASGDRHCVSSPLTDSKGNRVGVLALRFALPVEEAGTVKTALEAFAARAAAELERTWHEEELERSRQRYQNFVEFSSESIWRLDLDVPMPVSLGVEDKIRHLQKYAFLAECNDATVRHLGAQRREDLIGQRFNFFLSPSQPFRIEELRQLLQIGQNTLGQETMLRLPDGSQRWVARSVAGIREGDAIVRFWGMSRDITERKILEQEIRALSARRESLLEHERARISREIHDDLGQQLTALKIQMSALLDHARAGASPLEGQLTEMLSQVSAAITSTKQIATELRPPVLDHFGLAAAVEWHSGEFARTTGLACDCDAQEGIDPGHERSIAIFRILQESLNNAVRHAKATEVMVTLIEEDGDVVLRVSDNGVGMPDKSLRSAQGGLGLVGMRERASELGGELTISSRPGQGTAVEVRFPAESSSAASAAARAPRS